MNEHMTAESCIQIMQAYDQAETAFHNSEAYGDYKALECLLSDAVDDDLRWVNVSPEKNSITVGIKDREGDYGVYTFKLDKFFTMTLAEINAHDNKLMLEMDKVEKLNSIIRTVEYHRMNALDIAARKVKLEVEQPEWFLENKAVIKTNEALIEELKESKIKSFRWGS